MAVIQFPFQTKFSTVQKRIILKNNTNDSTGNTGWGKSRFTVVICETEFIPVLLIIVLFSTRTTADDFCPALCTEVADHNGGPQCPHFGKHHSVMRNQALKTFSWAPIQTSLMNSGLSS